MKLVTLATALIGALALFASAVTAATLDSKVGPGFDLGESTVIDGMRPRIPRP